MESAVNFGKDIYGDDNSRQSNSVKILHNDEEIPESLSETYSEWYHEITTGGRELVLRAEQGDTLALKAFNIDDQLKTIITCFEFLYPW